MKIRLYTLMILIVCSVAHSVTFVRFDQNEKLEVKNLPTHVTICFDVGSIGNTAYCEIFHDVNRNGRIDFDEPRVFFHTFVDGLGTIIDGDSRIDAIPGDETLADGFVKASIYFDKRWNPGCRQSWIVKITDSDKSFATAFIDWNLPQGTSGVYGKVCDEATGKPISGVVIKFVSESIPPACYRAVTDQNGFYSISLPQADYFVDLNADCKPCSQRVGVDKFSELNFFIKPYDTFFSGKVYLDNDIPASGIAVIAKKKDSGQLFQGVTDEKGEFVLGIEPGDYVVDIDQTNDKLSSIYMPELYSAMPSQFTFRAEKGEIVAQNFHFLLSTQSSSRIFTCNKAEENDAPAKVVCWADSEKLQKFYHSLSNADAGYALGMGNASLVRLFAQNEGGSSLVPLPNPNRRIDHNASHTLNFAAETSLMTLRGKVLDERGKPLVGVWIVARHAWENSPAAHLITRSNDRGEYALNISLEGDWRIGVFSQSMSALPAIYYKYVAKGIRCEPLNFVLSRKNVFLAGDERMLEPTPLSVMSRASAYRSKPIGYELPKMDSAKADIPILDDKELVKLIDSQMSQGFHSIVWDGQDEKSRLIMEKVNPSRLLNGE
ncbi:MAG: carboxypeptidase-like regulatory domain-containing protein [candidate division KSB1 bacterium]|nr:carboxypeptidase-like regulatory domain-containing protein [candidate division KSB1 bacterium]MDZ7346262.1 carboxypeptidase-like regulatory domain-containing protein [candidate division KSB1 bacterium]